MQREAALLSILVSVSCIETGPESTEPVKDGSQDEVASDAGWPLDADAVENDDREAETMPNADADALVFDASTAQADASQDAQADQGNPCVGCPTTPFGHGDAAQHANDMDAGDASQGSNDAAVDAGAEAGTGSVDAEAGTALIDAAHAWADASVANLGSCLTERSPSGNDLLFAPGAAVGHTASGVSEPRVALFSETLLTYVSLSQIAIRPADPPPGWSVFRRADAIMIADSASFTPDGISQEIVMAVGGERFITRDEDNGNGSLAVRRASDGTTVANISGFGRTGPSGWPESAGIGPDGSYFWIHSIRESDGATPWIRAYDASSGALRFSLVPPSGLRKLVATDDELLVVVDDSTSTTLRRFVATTGVELPPVGPLAGSLLDVFADASHVVTKSAGDIVRVYSRAGVRRAIRTQPVNGAGGSGSHFLATWGQSCARSQRHTRFLPAAGSGFGRSVVRQYRSTTTNRGVSSLRRRRSVSHRLVDSEQAHARRGCMGPLCKHGRYRTRSKPPPHAPEASPCFHLWASNLRARHGVPHAARSPPLPTARAYTWQRSEPGPSSTKLPS